jgi:hypothetical protein
MQRLPPNRPNEQRLDMQSAARFGALSTDSHESDMWTVTVQRQGRGLRELKCDGPDKSLIGNLHARWCSAAALLSILRAFLEQPEIIICET